ncbi:MAG: S8 family serine peptidase [Bacteroidales bacterium]|nr:S8 family serine peptidase [Bacteroidales bacterium]
MKTFMLNRSRMLVLGFITIFFFSMSSFAQTFEKYYLDGQLFVKFQDNYDPQIAVAEDHSVRLEDAAYFSDILSRYNVESISRPLEVNNDVKLLRTFNLKFEDHSVLEKVIAELEQKPEIEYAEKVALYYIDHKPNDSLYNLINGPLKWKWHLDVINAEQAWDITTGSPDIKVAIVDNAVWSAHPDLADKIVLQRDVVNNTANSSPPGTGSPGDWSHGTHCAGLATAITNNHLGVAGIGYNTSIIAIKAGHSNPTQISHSYAGVSFAINNGADIVSMSFGGPGFNQTFQNLVNVGNSMGVVFVAAAGNDNTNAPHYPSSYANVISVASTNDNDVKSDFSNYGTAVTVSAPGGFASPGPSGLLSTTFDLTAMGYYDSYFGTSMACPVVAGLASLMLSINPALTPAHLTNIMTATCDNIDAQNPNYIGQLGAGRINAYQAVLAVPFSPTADFSTPVTIILPGTAIDFTDLSIGVPDSYSWSFPGGTPSSSSQQNPSGIIYNTPGTYNVSLTVQNIYGSNSITLDSYIVVTSTPLPFIQFESSEIESCIYSKIVLEDLSLYNPTSWLWEFDPPNHVFVDGTNQNSQNPHLYFTLPGTYSITLSATNANGMNTVTFEDHFSIGGIAVPFEDDFESGATNEFELAANVKAVIKLSSRAANDSEYGLHFTGGSTPTGWAGTPTGTSPAQAWESNTDFHATAHVCNIDATEFAGIHVFFDLRQTFSYGNKLSWFRVLVNDSIQVSDSEGVFDFNPVTNEDPFVRKHFDLTEFGGTTFSLTFQSACRLYDYFYAQGDNAFVDNLDIRGSLVGSGEMIKIPVNMLSIFPNPAKNMVSFTYLSAGKSNVVVSLNSLDGKLVYNQNMSIAESRFEGNIPTDGIAPGLYILSLKDNDRVFTRKLVIE